MPLLKWILRSHKFKFFVIGFNALFILIFHQESNETYNLISSNDLSDLNSILKFLYDKNAFLVDYEKLQEISKSKNSTHLKINIRSFFNSQEILSFGVLTDEFNKINFLPVFYSTLSFSMK